MEYTKQMAEEWNKRAEVNALRYIDGKQKKWDSNSFFVAGEEFVLKEIDPFIQQYIKQPEHKTALDIGCGVGRIARAFSSRFGRVIGVDVSEKMIELAKSFHQDKQYKNITFLNNDGTTFVDIEEDSIDYVFSVVTFQHMPCKDIVQANIDEIVRVLKKGGVFQIDFPILQGWGQFFGIVPVPRVFRKYTPTALVRLYRYVRIHDELTRTETFRGATFTKKEAQKMFKSLEVSFQPNSWTDRKMWATGRKERAVNTAFQSHVIESVE
jgi:ubiquinone/menaquinone biosynthesis C-methylase UbiE